MGIPLKLSLSSVKKNGLLNQGVFEFAVYPPLLSLSAVDLSSHVTLSCASTYTVSEVSYGEGLLRVVADYTEDLEGRQCSLTLDFNSTAIVSPTASLEFTADSSTQPLVITKNAALIAASAFFFNALSYAALVLFAVSLSHKMIGAEVLSTFQLVYLSNCAYGRVSYFSYTTQDAGWVTGGWPLFAPGLTDDVAFLRDRVALSEHFLSNSLLVAVVLFVAVAVWAALLLCRGPKPEETPGAADNCFRSPRVTWAAVRLYTNLIFPVAAGFYLVLSLAAYLNGLRRTTSGDQRLAGAQGDSFSLLLCFSAAAVSFLEFFCVGAKAEPERQMVGLAGAKKWYIPVFLGQLAALSLLLQAGLLLSSFEVVVYGILCVLLVHFLIVLCGRPYKRALFNLSVLFCDLTSIYAFLMPILGRLLNMGE